METGRVVMKWKVMRGRKEGKDRGEGEADAENFEPC